MLQTNQLMKVKLADLWIKSCKYYKSRTDRLTTKRNSTVSAGTRRGNFAVADLRSDGNSR